MNHVITRLEAIRWALTPGVSLAPLSMMRSAALLGSVLAVVACDLGSLTAGPTAHCKESGAQCLLPTGPLGVCERSQCEASETPPCFKCTPQH